jgi:hypothetical protein
MRGYIIFDQDNKPVKFDGTFGKFIPIWDDPITAHQMIDCSTRSKGQNVFEVGFSFKPEN